MLKLYSVLNIGCEQLPHIGLGLMISVAETLKPGNNEPIFTHFLGEILNKVEIAPLLLQKQRSNFKGQTIEK